MNTHDEHDDDLEPEVIEGAEVETEHYADAEELEEIQPESDVTNPSGRADEAKPRAIDIEEEEQEGDASDTI